MRQIALDTETTGLSAEKGHRIIEIGAVEIINRKRTGKHFHIYLNPERDIEAEAKAVHGIEESFLEDKPRFAAIAQDFLDFIADAELVIHNAPFDLSFLNAELKRCVPKIKQLEKRCKVIDSLVMARALHPGQRNNLDALCKRYGIDNSARDLHGALIDADLLAKTYLAMTAGQDSLFDEKDLQESKPEELTHTHLMQEDWRDLLIVHASQEELDQHHAILKAIQK